jgi:hypothetical protein
MIYYFIFKVLHFISTDIFSAFVWKSLFSKKSLNVDGFDILATVNIALKYPEKVNHLYLSIWCLFLFFHENLLMFYSISSSLFG